MTLLPFPTFLDEIKEKGFRRAIYEGIDETVERISAGMNITDIREALRGEKPTRRPNPRLTPHADGFFLHIRPSYYNADVTGIYPTFRLGWLSTYFVILETITGIFLMIWYTPSPDVAYENMLAILGNVPLGQLMRDLHRLGAELMVMVVSLHMVRTWITGSYKKPRQFTFFTGVILLTLTGFLSFTGYLLPWDQLALWAVTIGASMTGAIPPEIVGSAVDLLFRGGPQIAENGLLRFYLLHVLALPALLFVFLSVHYYKVIIHGLSLPPQQEEIGEDTAKRVPLDKRVYFIPDVLTTEMMWLGLTTLILTVMSIWFFHAPLENHADPQVTPLGTTAPWYFLWIQGALKLGNVVFWGVIFPGIVLGFLAVWPYIDVAPSRRYAHRRLGISIILIITALSSVLSYMGLAEFGVRTSADQEILHGLSHPPAHNHVGIVRTIPFEQLVPGFYSTQQIEAEMAGLSAAVTLSEKNVALTETMIMDTALGDIVTVAGYITTHFPLEVALFSPTPADADELHAVLKRFYEEIHHQIDFLDDGWGGLLITETQPNLRRIDLLIFWNEVQLNEIGDAMMVDGENIPIFMPMMDEEGEIIGEMRSARLVDEHIFIHRNSAYFD
ncbi:MAG: cytochrome b N-terminal domain-containing protein [Anaerolineaceae bacterium]|nr:cytochrome b N-terminal domain-containing protein [Anaerolineaceae bacterium]